jgi:putative peptidoglycan lipid II flippase
VAVLYFAYRLIFFPLGIMSTALSQAILPTFSEQALDDDSSRLRDTFSWAMRLTFFLLVPAAVCFMALSLPIVTALFSGGRFDAESARVTAFTLSMYAVGLPLYGANRILQSCFFALKDTRTPAKIAAVGLISNITFNTLFMFPLKVSGIALATSVSGMISFALLFGVLRRRIGGCQGRQIASSLARVALAGLGMVGVFLFLVRFWPESGHQVYRWALLAAVMLAGSAVYLALCFALNLPELKEAARLARRKR